MSLLKYSRMWTGDRPSKTYDDNDIEDKQLIGKEGDESTDYVALLQAHKWLKRWLLALSVVIGLLVVALMLALSLRRIEDSTTRSLVPLMRSIPITFEHNDLFSGPSSPERDEAWSLMAPLGDGFILLPNSTAPGAYDLPLGQSTSRGQIYDISVFHQLHCLANIRRHMFAIDAILDRNDRLEIDSLALKPHDDHVYHCFDYIRQALMCAGDMTIEWPRTETDGSRFAVDGWGITHECKDWSAIMEFMEQNSVTKIHRM
ncbi:hypothetical protein LTR56_007504 [Elasticomyces elasticus]|nr:hypothetical protein LTR56_007504 [Elasticomyces elasticus]KAK3668174.1 hypothetical protein LTR22_000859 [Elasticomyces elasticus]KAK4921380.1 hypothetical protein LTR49_011210 [Elasticomyces elasticus]KAK5769499.1 hypothetical protein LTS12_000426 [Elasticomyces elasticus]